MKFIAMATFGSYLSTCPEPKPGTLGLTVYHRAFLLYSFLRSGEALNPEYYCGERQTGAGVGTQGCECAEMVQASLWGLGPWGTESVTVTSFSGTVLSPYLSQVTGNHCPFPILTRLSAPPI